MHRFLFLFTALIVTTRAGNKDELVFEVMALVSVDKSTDAAMPGQLNFLYDLYQHLRIETISEEEQGLACLACETAFASLIGICRIRHRVTKPLAAA